MPFLAFSYLFGLEKENKISMSKKICTNLSKINISEDNCDGGGDGYFLVLRSLHPYHHFVHIL
jgi:hypothetical protein